MSDEELKREHDSHAPNTQVGVDYYLDELRRRSFAKQQRLVVVITIANLIVAVVAAIAAIAALVS